MGCYSDVPEPRVLLVEKDPLASALYATVLIHGGFEVALAASGYEALRAVRAASHDVIVLDMALPDMSGLTLARRLRADPVTASVPIVALTLERTAADRAHALAAGCAACLATPVSAHALYSVIARAARRASSAPARHSRRRDLVAAPAFAA